MKGFSWDATLHVIVDVGCQLLKNDISGYNEDVIN